MEEPPVKFERLDYAVFALMLAITIGIWQAMAKAEKRGKQR